MNCPIREQTGDGTFVGRCWFHLPDGKTCPRHGDVSKAVERFTDHCKLTNESEHDPALKSAIKHNRRGRNGKGKIQTHDEPFTTR